MGRTVRMKAIWDFIVFVFFLLQRFSSCSIRMLRRNSRKSGRALSTSSTTEVGHLQDQSRKKKKVCKNQEESETNQVCWEKVRWMWRLRSPVWASLWTSSRCQRTGRLGNRRRTFSYIGRSCGYKLQPCWLHSARESCSSPPEERVDF